MTTQDIFLYEYYFDKLYPMGLMCKYTKSDVLEVSKINKVLLRNIETTSNVIREKDKKIYNISNRSFDNLDITDNIEYLHFFNELFFFEDPETWDIKSEYSMLVKKIVRFYKNKLDLQNIEYISQTCRYFELEIDRGKRVANETLLIIKSKVPEGIKSNLNKENGKSIYIDIYAVPQIQGADFIGIQNVIPEVTERYNIYQSRVESGSVMNELKRYRVSDHILKGLYFQMSILADADEQAAKLSLQITTKILSFTMEWRQISETSGSYDSFEEVNFFAFINSVFFLAMISYKSNIQNLPIQLLASIHSKINNIISKVINKKISTSVITEFINISNLWREFDVFKKGSKEPPNETLDIINKMRLKSIYAKDIKIQFKKTDENIVDKNQYYRLLQSFFEIFVNHIKYSKEKHFYVNGVSKSIILSNEERTNSDYIFKDPRAVVLGSNKYGLISLNDAFKDDNINYIIYKEDEVFIQKLDCSKSDLFIIV